MPKYSAIEYLWRQTSYHLKLLDGWWRHNKNKGHCWISFSQSECLNLSRWKLMQNVVNRWRHTSTPWYGMEIFFENVDLILFNNFTHYQYFIKKHLKVLKIANTSQKVAFPCISYTKHLDKGPFSPESFKVVFLPFIGLKPLFSEASGTSPNKTRQSLQLPPGIYFLMKTNK